MQVGVEMEEVGDGAHCQLAVPQWQVIRNMIKKATKAVHVLCPKCADAKVGMLAERAHCLVCQKIVRILISKYTD